MATIDFWGETYEVPEGHVCVHTRAVSGGEGGLNRNFDYFPSDELEKAAPTYDGCDLVFVDHHYQFTDDLDSYDDGIDRSRTRGYVMAQHYDPETDFHALLYFYGYGGAALYLAFCAWFPLLALWRLVKHRRRFWQYPWVPAGTFLLQLALGFGAALLSGSVLRRPSVTVYLALAAALLAHCLTRWDREQNAGCAGGKNMV